MKMAEKQFLTKKGYEERVALLENLKVVRRKEVAHTTPEYDFSILLNEVTSANFTGRGPRSCAGCCR